MQNRRDFLKTAIAAPSLAAASVLLTGGSAPALEKIQRVGGCRYKISLNAYSFNEPLRSGRMTLDDVLEFCAKLGFDAVDPTGYYFTGYPAVPDDGYVYRIKQKAFLNGLEMSGTGVRNDFTYPEPEKRIPEKQLVKNWIECAARLGAPVVRVFTGVNPPKDHSWDQAADWIAADIEECAEHGKKFGVMIGIQNHNDFLKTSDDILKLLGRIHSDWVGMILDIGSFRTDDPYKDIARIAPHAVSWQIKEMVDVRNRQVPVDLKTVVQIVKDAEYRGYLPIETLGQGDPKTKITKFYNRVLEAFA